MKILRCKRAPSLRAIAIKATSPAAVGRRASLTKVAVQRGLDPSLLKTMVRSLAASRSYTATNPVARHRKKLKSAPILTERAGYSRRQKPAESYDPYPALVQQLNEKYAQRRSLRADLRADKGDAVVNREALKRVDKQIRYMRWARDQIGQGNSLKETIRAARKVFGQFSPCALQCWQKFSDIEYRYKSAWISEELQGLGAAINALRRSTQGIRGGVVALEGGISLGFPDVGDARLRIGVKFAGPDTGDIPVDVYVKAMVCAGIGFGGTLVYTRGIQLKGATAAFGGANVFVTTNDCIAGRMVALERQGYGGIAFTDRGGVDVDARITPNSPASPTVRVYVEHPKMRASMGKVVDRSARFRDRAKSFWRRINTPVPPPPVDRTIRHWWDFL